MKSSHATNPRNTNTSLPPLARNAQGHPIPLPDGAAYFAIKRMTRGRPKVIKGPDGHPYRLALATTDQDVLDTFGPDTYRLDALDALGNVLDYVTTLDIGDDQAGDDEDDEHAPFDTSGPSSDLRFALQTITQVTKAQADSMRAIAEAQADFVKGLANAKALPRNAMVVAPAALRAPDDDHDDGDDESPPAPPAPSPPETPGWVAGMQAAQELGKSFAPLVDLGIAMFKKKFGDPTSPTPPTTPPAATATTSPPPSVAVNPMAHLAAINAALTDVERTFLGDVLQRVPGGETVAADLLARDVDNAIEFIREVIAEIQDEARARARAQARAEKMRHPRPESAPPPPVQPAPGPRPESTTTEPGAPAPGPAPVDFTARLLAVATRLDADQCATVLKLIPRLAPERIEHLKAQLLAMDTDEAAAWIRDNLAALRAEVAEVDS